MSKKRIYLLGLMTLVVFPIPTFLGLYFFEGTYPLSVLQFETLTISNTFYGIFFGFIYAIAAMNILKNPVFKDIPLKIDQIIKELDLNYADAIVLSVCAGVGEELLFRSGIQFYLGIVPTSILFVAIHGYFSIKKIKTSLYGLVVLPFILLISIGFIKLGLWFSVFAHFSYDLVLFIGMIREIKKSNHL
jgi:membrane protease YdiL (CAAX protease family)